MISRREFIKPTAAAGMYSTGFADLGLAADQIFVNDIHSQLNRTRVSELLQPLSTEELQRIVRRAAKERNSVSIAGGRHAMGGQQFGTNSVLVDMTKMNRVLHLNTERGLLEVEAGIEWPQLIDAYLSLQKGTSSRWGIAQKQTGADRISIGGTIAANGHGRGLKMKPFVSNVESFVLIDAEGNLRQCSRSENPDLFHLVHGGYGLFGIVAKVTLQLVPREKVQRVA